MIRSSCESDPLWEQALVGAGPARERERSSRQDSRGLSNGGADNRSGILPGGYKPPFRGQGPLAQVVPQGLLAQINKEWQ